MTFPLEKYRPVFNAFQEGSGAPEGEPPSSATEAPQEPSTPVPAPATVVPQGLLDELTKLRAKNREIAAERDNAQQRARDAQSLAERLAKGEAAHMPGAQQETQRSAPVIDDEEVNRRAAQIIHSRDVQSLGNNLREQFGQARFAEADKALAALAPDGGSEFLQSLIAVTKTEAHKILNDLTDKPAELQRIINLDPISRAAELTRMSIVTTSAAESAPAARKGVSRAPAPAPAVEPSATKVRDWDAINTDPKTSDAEWSKAWEARQRERRGGR
jgi:hypothetical protein